jgi:hypothetical protein
MDGGSWEGVLRHRREEGRGGATQSSKMCLEVVLLRDSGEVATYRRPCLDKRQGRTWWRVVCGPVGVENGAGGVAIVAPF